MSGPSKDQKGAMAGTRESAQQVGAMGQPLMSEGLSMSRAGGTDLDAAGNYYRNILSSRVAGRESLAPEMTSAMEFYRGAEGKAKRTLRGGGRDYALAELDRQKVGQMAGMLPAARRSAAEGAAGVGATRVQGGSALTGQGVNAATSAGWLNQGLFNQASQIRQQEREGGSSWGKFLGDLIQSAPWGKGGGGGGVLPSKRLPMPTTYPGPRV